MGHTIKNEDFKAEIILPQPFTGAHYMAWDKAYNEAVAQSQRARSILAMLAVLENGFYIEGGIERNLKEHGLNAPLHILIWAGTETLVYVSDSTTVPKPSTPTPPAPRTT